MMNQHQIELVDDLVNLLVGSDRISRGAQAVREWCSDFVGLGFTDNAHFGYGGLIVPQSGQGSGMPISFSFVEDKTTARRVNEMVSSCWRSSKDEDLSLKFAPGIAFVASLISTWFDRPIGLLWCLVSDDDIKHAKVLLRYLAATIALVVRASKGARALDFLSLPIWKAEGSSRTTQEAADSIARACMETLGCKAGIVWEVDENEHPPMLKTLAMVGEVADAKGVDMPLGVGLAGKCAQVYIGEHNAALRFAEDAVPSRISVDDIEVERPDDAVFVLKRFMLFGEEPAFRELDLSILDNSKKT